MASFTPPTRSDIPPVLPEGDLEQNPVAFRLFRFFRARPSGINVFLYKNGTYSASRFGQVTETDPVAIYNSSGVAVSDGWEDLQLVFWGGHGAVIIDDDVAQLLVDAGYTVDDFTPVPGAPTLTNLSPASGVAGATITLTGTVLDTVTDVTVDGVSVGFTHVSTVSLTFLAPAHVDGAVSVRVTNVSGNSNSETFTYSTVVTPPPTDAHPGSDLLDSDGSYFLDSDSTTLIDTA